MAGDLYDAIFTGNVSKEGQRIVKGGEERGGARVGGRGAGSLTPGLVILFMVNTVSTSAVKEKALFSSHISKHNLVFISSLFLFLMNGFFHT